MSDKYYYLLGPSLEQVVNDNKQAVRLAIVSEMDIAKNITGEFTELVPLSQLTAAQAEMARLRGALESYDSRDVRDNKTKDNHD